MRKPIVAGVFVLALMGWACRRQPPPPPPQQIKPLFKKMGCTNCHDIRNTIGGPSFEMIATRYPHDPDTIRAIVKRIMQGSRGRWSGMPLEECPKKVGKGYNAQEMYWLVDWILKRAWESPSPGG